MDSVRAGLYGQPFRPVNFVLAHRARETTGQQGDDTGSQELCESILDVTCKAAEVCDTLQGFQLVGSLGGGPRNCPAEHAGR
jgi:tubulin beta